MIEEMSVNNLFQNVNIDIMLYNAAIAGDEALVSQLIGLGEVTVDWRGGLFTPL